MEDHGVGTTHADVFDHPTVHLSRSILDAVQRILRFFSAFRQLFVELFLRSTISHLGLPVEAILHRFRWHDAVTFVMRVICGSVTKSTGSQVCRGGTLV